MKRVISEVTYNTLTSTIIHTWRSQKEGFTEKMFQTRGGEFFLHREKIPDGSGEENLTITPIDAGAVCKWVSYHMTESQRLDIFGDRIRTDVQSQLALRLPPVLRARVKRDAKTYGLSVAAWLIQAVEEYLLLER